jgi:biopolymer transport protein TolQ
MFALFFQAGLVIKLVLLTLIGLSVVSWGIILYKYLQLRGAAQESRGVLEAFQACGSGEVTTLLTAAKDWRASPFANLVKAAAASPARGSREAVSRAIANSQAQEVEQIESYLIFLATTGSVAPFIGLFGTVWGIMNAFQGIGSAGSASLAVVAPAIAEALVATAAGLAAAIPAVMAYNFFVNWSRKLTGALDEFADGLRGLVGGRAAP